MYVHMCFLQLLRKLCQINFKPTRAPHGYAKSMARNSFNVWASSWTWAWHEINNFQEPLQIQLPPGMSLESLRDVLGIKGQETDEAFKTKKSNEAKLLKHLASASRGRLKADAAKADKRKGDDEAAPKKKAKTKAKSKTKGKAKAKAKSAEEPEDDDDNEVDEVEADPPPDEQQQEENNEEPDDDEDEEEDDREKEEPGTGGIFTLSGGNNEDEEDDEEDEEDDGNDET